MAVRTAQTKVKVRGSHKDSVKVQDKISLEAMADSITTTVAEAVLQVAADRIRVLMVMKVKVEEVAAVNHLSNRFRYSLLPLGICLVHNSYIFL